MRIKSFSAFALILPVILLSVLLSGCGPKVESVSASSITVYGDGQKISQADAVQQGLPMTVWGFKGTELTSGPYKGWNIYSDGNTISGLNEYMIAPGSGSSIQEFYNNELSGDDKWAKGKDVSGEGYSGYTWTRGSQAFVAIVVETDNISILITYLLNK